MDFKNYRDILVEQMLMCGVTRSMSKCISLLEEYHYDLNKLSSSYGFVWEYDVLKRMVDRFRDGYPELSVFEDDLIRCMLDNGISSDKSLCRSILRKYDYDLTKITNVYGVQWGTKLLNKIQSAYYNGKISRDSNAELKCLKSLMSNPERCVSRSSSRKCATASSSKIVVRTKEDLKLAIDRGYDEILVEGSLADDLIKTKCIATASPAAIAALTAAIGLMPVSGGLSTLAVAPVAALSGFEISAIIIAAAIGLAIVMAVYKNYNVRIEEDKDGNKRIYLEKRDDKKEKA